MVKPSHLFQGYPLFFLPEIDQHMVVYVHTCILLLVPNLNRALFKKSDVICVVGIESKGRRTLAVDELALKCTEADACAEGTFEQRHAESSIPL